MTGTSVPCYGYRAGPCIVAGSARCLHDDLERAWKVYPDASVIAVNGASREVDAFMLVSQHPENFVNARWIARQRKRQERFTVHSTSRAPGVDYVWDLPHRGGSAWLARRIAGTIGLSPVILCGVPMEPGPYTSGSNIGGYMHRPDVVDELFGQIERDVEWHAGVVSMSGRTMKLLDNAY